jgi:sucrose-6-phosphate hydrolase SacC (GH32 family)
MTHDPAAPQRPHVHFSPPSGWMNDPNGLLHVDGVYHLFYQHHPDSLVWGPMHWGHATSRDLVAWEHHPIALRPDHLGTAFSGSAVLDVAGDAGLGRGAMVLFYTHFREDEPQSQGLASSVDGGETWTPYSGNPVLDAPPGLIDFRDPKVIRYGAPPGEPGGHWVMVVVAGDEVVLHRSDDLLGWTESGRFGRGYGAHGGAWETPDLFELEVDGTGERRWVLVVSVLGGGPAGGTGTQYFVGSFDGDVFTCEDPPGEIRWVDHGADFYAPQSWTDAPGGRRTWLAWMSNWAYARTVPASTWRGAMTVARDDRLRHDGRRAVLAQQPAEEIEARGRVLAHEKDLAVGPGAPWEADAPAAYELRLRLDGGAAGTTYRGAGGATRLTYDPARGVLHVLRSDRGLVGVDPPGGQEVAVPVRDGEVEIRLLVDTCSVEVFADGGAVVLTNQVFPMPDASGVALHVVGAPAQVRSVELRDLTAR